MSSTHCFISINLYHVANISGIFRVSYKKSLLVLKMYAHSYRASNRIKLHHALVMTHAVTRYNTSRLSCRTKNQPSYESSPPWEADVLYKTRQAMYVSHTTVRSRKVYTFSAILTPDSFTQRQRFYDDTNILCKVHFCYSLWREVILCLYRQYDIHRSFATRVSQLKKSGIFESLV